MTDLHFKIGDLVHIPQSWMYLKYGVGTVTESISTHIKVSFPQGAMGFYSLSKNVVYLDKDLCFYNS